MRESYELGMYFMARHTAIDCFEKRGKRGYLFMIGDELAYPKAKRREIAKVIGDERAKDVPIAELVRELQRKYDVYFIIPEGAYHSGSRELADFWRGLLGQNVLYLDDLDAVCETIALTIGLAEDAIDLDEGLEHLAEAGSDAGASVSRALARLDAARAPVAVSSTPPGLDASGPSATTRL
jgi:hypothetical protein